MLTVNIKETKTNQLYAMVSFKLTLSKFLTLFYQIGKYLFKMNNEDSKAMSIEVS